MNIKIRTENKDDRLGVRKVLELAFAREVEAKLVEKLRHKPNFVPELSLVAEYENDVVGYILFFPIVIESSSAQFETSALAVLAVLPEYQKKGVGKKLVGAGLDRTKKAGFNFAIVVGHPEYYPKFGFEAASKYNIKAPFDVPDNAFLAVELKKDGLKNVSGTVKYPSEFNEV